MDDNIVSNVYTGQALPSDHATVMCDVQLTRPKAVRKMIISRSLKSVDMEKLKDDIESSRLVTDPPAELHPLMSTFDNELRSILEKHAPLTEKNIMLRPHAPWYTKSLREAKQKLRQCERKATKPSATQTDKTLYANQCRMYNDLLLTTKKLYFQNQIKDANQRQLFRVIDKLTSPVNKACLPNHTCAAQLANTFADFFRHKIDRLRNQLDQCNIEDLSVDIADACEASMDQFDVLSEDQVLSLIKSTSSSTCDLDPLPSVLIKACTPVLLPVITKLVNLSLQSASVPPSLKQAIMTPRLKKHGLSTQELSNYRPISNIHFISKVMEKAVAAQIQDYLALNNLNAPTQSAYRRHHSVETALVLVQNDILQALDCHEEVIIVLLDFTAAFDTIDHQILLKRLPMRFGISGNVLKWLTSYVSDRQHVVKVENTTSSPVADMHGIPQGSVMGPVLFALYSSPIHDIIRKHELKSMIYADDIQIYVSFKPPEREKVISQINACIKDIHAWATGNKMSLNASKTEVLYLSSKFVSKSSPSVSIIVGDKNVESKAEVRNLGVMMDEHLTMSTHISNLCRSAMTAIRKIGQIRQYLDRQTTLTLVHAFVTSRLDSCNALLANLTEKDIGKLQRLQNIAARIVQRARHHEHITPILSALHWLPIDKRIKFKIILLTFKALNGTAPTYISDILHTYTPTRTLRSQHQHLLQAPRFNTQHYWTQIFQRHGTLTMEPTPFRLTPTLISGLIQKCPKNTSVLNIMFIFTTV